MPRIVIAAYKPKDGQADALRCLMRTHVQVLRDEGLVTDRAPICMESESGTVVEVFEWKSKEAIDKAHSNPKVLAMWNEYAKVCDFVPVDTTPEAEKLFSEYTPLDF